MVFKKILNDKILLSLQYYHFHGTEDKACKYWGENPGPDFLAGAEVLPAQRTDFLWARAMGHTGPQLEAEWRHPGPGPGPGLR